MSKLPLVEPEVKPPDVGTSFLPELGAYDLKTMIRGDDRAVADAPESGRKTS